MGPWDQYEAGRVPVACTLSHNTLVEALHACMRLMGRPMPPPNLAYVEAAMIELGVVLEREDDAAHAAFQRMLDDAARAAAGGTR